MHMGPESVACPAGLADEALSALEAKAVHAQALDAELAELRAALDLQEQQVAKHATEAERLSQKVGSAFCITPYELSAQSPHSSRSVCSFARAVS